MLLLLLSRALVRPGRSDMHRCFPLLILHPPLSLPQITPQRNRILAARACYILMAMAQPPPVIYPKRQLPSLLTSTRTLPSMPNCFVLQKPGEVLLLSIPHRHSRTHHRRHIMMEDTRRWIHKGEFIFFVVFHVGSCSFISMDVVYRRQYVLLLVCISLFANDNAGTGIVMAIPCFLLTTRRQ